LIYSALFPILKERVGVRQASVRRSINPVINLY
jgi:hypothetical protein